MKKMINKVHLEGLLYESNLEQAVAGPNAKNPGVNYIRGSISIEVEEGNVVTCYYRYSAPNPKNTIFQTLQSVMDSPSVVANGRENAVGIKIDSALAPNDWFTNELQPVLNVRPEGGFIHVITKDIKPSATFEVDMLITNCIDELEKDETGMELPNGKLLVNGYIFNYKNEICPITFHMDNEKGLDYFKQMQENTFTKVWGILTSIHTSIEKVEESAFGEDHVVVINSSRKRNIIQGTNKIPYNFGDPKALTPQEVQEALAVRETFLATQKANKETYLASQSGGNAVQNNVAINEDVNNKDFHF